MTPEQKAYYDKELARIRRGGDSHDAYEVKAIHGLGGYIGPVDPPVVGFGQDGDPFYQQYFQNWHEINTMIRQLRETAEKTFGPDPDDFKSRLAQAIETMPFGDTAASFAAFVRDFK